MEKAKNVNPPFVRNLIIAFILATLIFVGTFLIGYSVAYAKYREVTKSQETLRYNLLSFDIEKKLVSENCSKFNPYLFSGSMDELGNVLGILEERLGKKDAEVLAQKKIYVLLELQHMFYVLEHNSKCPNKVNTVFFFYSNEIDDKSLSEKTGFMLSSIKNSGKEVMIYSFDWNLNSDAINLLKEKYGVGFSNTVIINEKTKLVNPSNVQEVLRYLF